MEKLTKICTKCGIEKSLEDFHKDKNTKDGRRSWCKDCSNQYRREHRNIEKEKEYAKNHKKESRDRQRKYRERHPEKGKEYYYKAKESGQLARYLEDNKEKIKEQRKLYYEKNKEKIIYKVNKWKEEKRKSDPLFKLKDRIRGVIYDSFRRYGTSKPTHTKDIVGLDVEDFRNYLLQTFINNYGYEWDGIEKIHIDHIIPLSTAKNEEDIIKLCHYTNLQLLKAEDNVVKSDKLDWSIDQKETSHVQLC